MRHDSRRNSQGSSHLVLLQNGGGLISTTEGALRLAVHPDLKGNEAGLLEALLACTDYGVLITSMTTRQDILCNQRFGEIFGVNPDDAVLWTPSLVQEHVLPRIKEPDAFLKDLRRVYNHPTLERVDELELVQPDQVLRRHTTPLLNEDGKILARVWTFLDITALKTLQRQVEIHARNLETLVEERTRALWEMQQQLIESEKLAAVGMLSTSVAHDLRNILTPLTVELSALPGKDRYVVDALEGQIQRLTAMTHRLLSFSQPIRLEVSTVDLRAVWKEVECLIQSQAEFHHCQLVVSLPLETLLVAVNIDQIKQIFVNLSMNALSVMSSTGGTLTVEFGTSEGKVFARFADTGPSVPLESVDSLFEPFMPARMGSIGLSLFSSRRIAREHGGEVTLQNGESGAAFVVTLPLENAPSDRDLHA